MRRKQNGISIVKTIDLYKKELNKCKVISKEEEIDLLIKAKNNNLAARNKLVTSNLKFVFNIAKIYANKGADIEDLIAEGNIALYNAIDRFDISTNNKFITYAVYWIKNSMVHYLMKLQKIKAYEYYVEDEYNKKFYDNSFDEEDDELDDEIIEKSEIYSFADNDDENEYEEYKKNITNEMIEKMLGKLNKNGQFVIKYYYGIGLKKRFNIKEIAEMLNITPQRVHKIKERQIKILRSELLMLDDINDLL